MVLRRVEVSIVMMAVITNHSAELVSQFLGTIRERSFKSAEKVDSSPDNLKSGVDLMGGWLVGWPNQAESGDIRKRDQLSVHEIEDVLARIFIIVLGAAFKFLRGGFYQHFKGNAGFLGVHFTESGHVQVLDEPFGAHWFRGE